MSKLTPKKRESFLAALMDGESVTSAAKSIGLSRQALYRTRLGDEKFAADWDDAVECGTDCLEDEAVKRARDGSDTLLIFMLKARRPEKFKDRVANEHTGRDGGPIETREAKSLTDDELLSIALRGSTGASAPKGSSRVVN